MFYEEQYFKKVYNHTVLDIKYPRSKVLQNIQLKIFVI
jgi:hypothetical protein